MIVSSFCSRRRCELGFYKRFSIIVTNEDVTERFTAIFTTCSGSREVDCNKIAVTLTRCEQVENFDILSLD